MEKGKLIQNKVHLEPHEYATVKIFLEQGYDVELIPRSQIKGMHRPDIKVDGAEWEMKAPKEDGRYTIKNIIQSASHQSANIIIDLRRCKMDEVKAFKEIARYFKLSKRIRRIKVIGRDEKILDLKK